MIPKRELFVPMALFFLIFLHESASQETCKINVKKDMHEQHPPLLVQSDSNNLEYVYPDVADGPEIVLQAGESVNVFCPGKTNPTSTALLKPGWIEVKGKKFQESDTSVAVECTGKGKFDIEGKKVQFADISCMEEPRASYNPVLRETGQKCGSGYKYEIGFVLKDGSFLQTIELCHDVRNANTLWSHGLIASVNDVSVRYTGGRKASFKTGILYENMTLSMVNPYSLNHTYVYLTELFKSSAVADKYASPKMSDRKFLAVGHLIANADMVYKSQQMSTFFYANAVPMWQQVNAKPGNWFFVEEYVRFLAVHKKRSLHAWAGGIGVLELEGKPIYLYNRQKEDSKELEHKIPVPRNLYKCVVDKKKKEAMCFVVVNNPYATTEEIVEPSNNYKICKPYPLCNRLSNSFEDTTLGVAYCCTLDNFYNKNKDETALEDFKPFLGYKPLELLANDKNNPQVITDNDVPQEPKKNGRKARKYAKRKNAYRAISV